jgi:hypothetical protein
MAKLIGEIILIAVAGSLGVPILMLGLAKLGYFPAVYFRALGKTWEFAPRRSAPLLQEQAVITFPKSPTTIGTVKFFSQTFAARVAIDQQPMIVETSANSSTVFVRSPATNLTAGAAV